MAPWIPPQTQSRLWKDPTNSSTLCATRREKQFQGHQFWQEEVDRVGESSGESRREFSVAVVLMSLCPGCHKRDRGLSVLTGHQAMSLPARK